VDGNLLALIYSIRSIVIVCVILSLMFRLPSKTVALDKRLASGGKNKPARYI
jgi:hypothetical protein